MPEAPTRETKRRAPSGATSAALYFVKSKPIEAVPLSWRVPIGAFNVILGLLWILYVPVAVVLMFLYLSIALGVWMADAGRTRDNAPLVEPDG